MLNTSCFINFTNVNLLVQISGLAEEIQTTSSGDALVYLSEVFLPLLVARGPLPVPVVAANETLASDSGEVGHLAVDLAGSLHLGGLGPHSASDGQL
jgi:hypothetical protein